MLKGAAMKNRLLVLLGVALPFFYGCAAMQFSGEMTRKTGEAMSGWGEKHGGILGAGARFGGKVNTTVGALVEDAAQDSDHEKK